MRLSVLATLAAIASPCYAEQASLDFLQGDWLLLDPTGKQVGTSHVEVRLPGAMIYELRSDANGKLPVWFAASEAKGGWVQFFPGPKGSLREFDPVSKAGTWPVVLGNEVVLRDGRSVTFRLTLDHASDNASHRVLEMSSDGRKTWSTVFDYRYVRPGSH